MSQKKEKKHPLAASFLESGPQVAQISDSIIIYLFDPQTRHYLPWQHMTTNVLPKDGVSCSLHSVASEAKLHLLPVKTRVTFWCIVLKMISRVECEYEHVHVRSLMCSLLIPDARYLLPWTNE